MHSRNHVRRSLFPTFKAKDDFCSSNRNKLSDISDASDAEWDNLQSKLQVTDNIYDTTNQNFENEFIDPIYNNIENMPVCANMELQIDAKQKELERVQQIALDLQDRFVWDLSLAIKKELFRKNFHDLQKREDIANVGIQGIVDRNQNDPKSPEEWKDWITEQYPHAQKI